MNSDTGQIQRLIDKTEEEIRQATGIRWVPWNVGELVEIKGCFFRVHSINTRGNRVTFKGISRNEYVNFSTKGTL